MKKLRIIFLAVILCGCSIGEKQQYSSSETENIDTESSAVVNIDEEEIKEEETMIDYEDVDSIYVLVNKTHPLSEDYEPKDLINVDAAKIRESCLMREEAAEALKKMFEAAEEDGIDLMLVSGYRSYSYQRDLFNSYVARDGEEAANRYSARPGQSEHQTGLAADLSTTDQACLLMNCFKDTEAGQWLKENAHLFGFILRYPEDKEEITGYIFEPWHFRYIGLETAYLIHESGLTFEEYIQVLD